MKNPSSFFPFPLVFVRERAGGRLAEAAKMPPSQPPDTPFPPPLSLDGEAGLERGLGTLLKLGA